MRAGRSHDVSFAHKVDEKYYVMNPQQPEMAVCYKEDDGPKEIRGRLGGLSVTYLAFAIAQQSFSHAPATGEDWWSEISVGALAA